MAAIACPTWTEVSEMPLEILEAMNIVKGELNGDEFLWDHKFYDAEGRPQSGIWKSQIENRDQNRR